jgi:hypothetical protein
MLTYLSTMASNGAYMLSGIGSFQGQWGVGWERKEKEDNQQHRESWKGESV